MTLIDKWDGFDAMVDAADAAAFDVTCEAAWPTLRLHESEATLADERSIVSRVLSTSREEDVLAWAHEPIDLGPDAPALDYIPANLPA